MTVARIAQGLAKKEFSAREVADAYLSVAGKKKSMTNAYVTISAERAIAEAGASDARRADGSSFGPLDGVPIAYKDNILVNGIAATSATKILKDYVAPYDATVVSRLKAAGMVTLGKTNMDELAMGATTETSCHGPTRNPWDEERIPGGSSGGSAAAVAEGSAPISLGSDTGGSIRQPAAMCGVVGLKPTYGRVSRYGLTAMASSLDQIGPIAKTVEDAALLLSAIEGHDPKDSTSVHLDGARSLGVFGRKDLSGIRVGLPKEYFGEGMDAGVRSDVDAAVEAIRGLGAEIKEVSLPHADKALAVYYIVMPCEVSANLARLDGMRYGARVGGATLDETYMRSRGEGFGDEVRRRIMIGTHALSSGYYDAYYIRAQKVRRLIANDFTRAFEDVDCILTPTAPEVAWKMGAKNSDPLALYLSDIYTVCMNVAGLPAVSVPCGMSEGLPVGLQIVGKHFDERTLLGVAHAYEAARGPFATPPNA